MIRVNLLPYRQQRKRSAGKAQLAIFAAVLIAELVVIALLWGFAQSELEREEQRVRQYQQEVAAAEEEVKDAKQLEAQKAQVEQQLGVLDRLEAQRSGPVRVLDEFQSMISRPRNEEDRFAQLQKNWNVDWDPRRLWVESLIEKDGRFTLDGGASNADDVAEFLQRMSGAEYFTDVELNVVQAQAGSKGGAPTVVFKLHGNVIYEGRSHAAGAK